MPVAPFAEFLLGDTLVRFQAPAAEPGALGLLLLPRDRAGASLAAREHLDAPDLLHLPARWRPVQAWEVDPLIHVQLQGGILPGAFAQGRTSHGGPISRGFRVQSQTCDRTGAITIIRTVLMSPAGLTGIHEIIHHEQESALRVHTTVRNDNPHPVTLELLSSFSLGGLTPFAADDAPGRLWLHRFRSAWSAEGRHEARLLEDLNLERSWIGHGVRAERFGQIGSLPTNGFFPWLALEDRATGVCWGAMLAHPGSWQMEVYRRADQVALAGGLADRESGHWARTLVPGESFTAPEARLACSTGGIDDLAERLLSPVRRARTHQPAAERELPVVCNEWCTSWGNPNHDNLVALADRLRGSGVRYLVIDDGWAERPGDGIQQNGDWRVNRAAFPQGLRATADAIRARGLVPGLWFEAEVVNAGSDAWRETAHQLHRDGVPLQVGTRRFWDFRDPWVHAYLEERLTGLLRENGFGYLKLDYNDNIGLGCDGAESPGEGLRQHLDGVQRFLRRLRTQLPDLVIENCSSGGHRAEPSMMELTAMTSFSDAHESRDIPLIAASLNRLVPAPQSQIWAVLRRDDSPDRLSYSLAAAFLGRMCLSGDIPSLPPANWEFTLRAIALYREQAPLIAAGHFRCHRETGPSWQHPTGWQAVVVTARGLAQTMVVWHTFANPPAQALVPLPPGCGRHGLRQLAAHDPQPRIDGETLYFETPGPWTGGVIVLD